MESGGEDEMDEFIEQFKAYAYGESPFSRRFESGMRAVDWWTAVAEDEKGYFVSVSLSIPVGPSIQLIATSARCHQTPINVPS